MIEMREFKNRKYWKNLFLITTFILLLPLILVAQDGSGQGGTRSNFTFGFGARAMGMGNAFSMKELLKTADQYGLKKAVNIMLWALEDLFYFELLL